MCFLDNLGNKVLFDRQFLRQSRNASVGGYFNGRYCMTYCDDMTVLRGVIENGDI